MRRLLNLCALLALLCGAAHAGNYTYGAWSFTLPDGAKQSVQDGIRAFGVDGGVYLFTPPEPLGGRTLEQVAAATMKEITGGNTGGLKGLGKQTLDGGTVLLPFSGAVINSQAGTGNLQTYFFFAKNGQWGLALLMMDADADQETVLPPLSSVKFNPGNSGSVTAAGPGAPAAQASQPRLPALPWATPAANRTVSSVPGTDFPTARKKGLDPRRDLLPDVFDCYFVGEYLGDDLRAMSPTPDLRVQISANGSYALNDGASKSSGRWAVTREGGQTKGVSMEGPLTARNIYVKGGDDGQAFEATHAGTRRGVFCYQNGPRAELLRLELTKRRIGSEPLTCQDAGGGPSYKLTFGESSYSTPKGQGRARLVFSGNDSGDWQGLASFSGGPFDLATGEMTEDDEGNREFEITEKITSGSLFYRSTETRLIALCRARVTPRPEPLYGRNAAPKTGMKGGPDGLFVSLQNHPRIVGNILMQWYELELGLFRPDGYMLAGVDPTDLGGLPDCTRTKPNGDPYCQRYELKGSKLRVQDRDGDWDDAEAFAATPSGFKLGDITYSRVTPPKATDLVGVFSTEDFKGNGPLGGNLFGGAGFYNSLSSGYQFTPDGKFQWKYSSSNSTLISPNLINGGGVVGGGGSTRTDGGQGSYTLQDNWLTLKFSDGRTQRLYVYAQPASARKEDPTLPVQLNIGGSWLNKAPTR